MRSDVLNANSNDFLKDAEGVMVARIHAELSDFTDGGGTSGTYATGVVIPKGAIVLNSLIEIINETGASTLTCEIGDGSDADRFNASSDPSLDTVGLVSGGAPQGTALCTSDASITLTVTEGSDFGDVTALNCKFWIYYYLPAEFQTQKNSLY